MKNGKNKEMRFNTKIRKKRSHSINKENLLDKSKIKFFFNLLFTLIGIDFNRNYFNFAKIYGYSKWQESKA